MAAGRFRIGDLTLEEGGETPGIIGSQAELLSAGGVDVDAVEAPEVPDPAATGAQVDSPAVEEPAAALFDLFQPVIQELPPENGERTEADPQVIALVPAGQLPEGEAEEEKDGSDAEEGDGELLSIDLVSPYEEADAGGYQEEVERGGLRMVVVHEAPIFSFRPGRLSPRAASAAAGRRSWRRRCPCR